MLSRGKLSPLPDRIRGVDEIKRIFAMCEPGAEAASPAGGDDR
jgi:hypothetical protein